MKGKSKGAGLPKSRGNRLVQETVHDPYKARRKSSGLAVCTECGVVFDRGRWAWRLPPAKVLEMVCPACRRIRDKVPAGVLHISGPILETHREQVLNLVRNEAEAEKKARPLHRMMEIAEQDDGLLLTTTDTHLPRRIGNALHQAFHGELALPYGKDARVFRADWRG